LEEQNRSDLRSSVAEPTPTINRETLNAFSESKSKILSLRVELEEAQKTIKSLKEVIERHKQQARDKEDELLDEKRSALHRQELLFSKQREDNIR
jgi:hypothetical protein